MRRVREDLLEGPVGPTLVRLTGPMVLAILSTSFSALVDAWFVGRLGSRELSVLGFSYPVILVLTNLAMGLGVGTGSVVARSLGAGAMEKVRPLVAHSLELGLALSLGVGGLGLLTLSPLFRQLGATEEVLPLLRSYMAVWYLGLPVLFLALVANSVVRSTGDTRLSASALIVTAVLGALIDPLLIFGWGPFPRLEVVGAAWAALIARAAGLAVSLWVLIRRDRLLGWKGSEGRLRSWSAVLGVAVPATITRLAFPVSMAIITGMVASYGPTAVAALGLCNRIETLLMVVVVALATALLPFVGQNWGAGRIGRVRQGIELSGLASLLWGGTIFLVMALAAPAVASLFSRDPQVVEVTSAYLRIVSLSYGFQGISTVVASAFNAVNRPLASSAITLARMFALYIPLAWLGSSLWGLTGVFVGASTATVLTGVGAWIWGRRVFAGMIEDS
ncbi:MAG TPA: MATE family efflux transporter [Thermoanaerobaculia bacterium]|nr:MATE family efflux transporter [Thermoanaerobaculia bacterium]